MASRSTNTSSRRRRSTDRSRSTGGRSARPANRQRRSSSADSRRPIRERRPSRERRPDRERRPSRERAIDTHETRSKQPSSGRNLSLDGFRALAILSVLFYHLDVAWLPSGHLGVVMFLVLTGYLVTSSLLRRLRNGVSAIPSFWLGRFARIWPSAAVMIAFTVLACVIGNHVLLTKARPDILPGLALFENLSYILRNVSYFEQIGGPSPLTHLWYIGIDAQFCLVWPIIMLLFALLPSRSTARRITLVGAVASAIAMGVLYNPDAGVTRVYYGPDTRAFAPLIGAWLAYAVPLGRRPARDLRDLFESGRLGIELGACIALVALVVGMVLIPDTSVLLYRGGMFVAALLSCLVLAALALPGGILSSLFGLPPVAWLGSRSYGIYLWHYPLIQLLGAANNTAPWWKPVLVIVLSLVLAELSYRLIEQPVGRLLSPKPVTPSSRSKRPSSAVAAPVVLAGAAALALVVIADGIGLALIEPETLVPEDAIVSTGEDAGHAMDLTKNGTSEGNAEGEDAAAETTEKVEVPATPPADAVLHAPAAEKAAGIYDPVLIGDSVPGDAKEFWDASFPDGLLDSYVGRRPDQAVTVLDEYLAQGVVGQVVILQAFSNVPATTEQVEHMIQACGPDRDIFIVNVRIPEVEEAQINATLAAAAEAHDNVELIDWHGLTESYNDWIYPDGEHLTPTGQPVYINMLLEAIYHKFTDAGGTITTRSNGATATAAPTQTTDTSATQTTDGADAQTTDGTTSTEQTADNASGDTNQASTGMVIGESAEADAAETTQTASMRILMLGNSFTYYNDMPAMLANLTNAEVVTHARGGAILSEQLSSDNQMGEMTLAALKEGDWDYVVMQEKSSRPIRSNSDDYLESVTKLAELARESGATPVIFATWPYNESAGRLKNMDLSREEMDEQLHAAFSKAASSSGALVADVEGAFATASSHELLYAQDGVHPSVIGSKLAAEVIAQTIENDRAEHQA